MRKGFDEYVLSYVALRIDAGLDYIVSSREPDFLGSLGGSIREEWASVSRLLKRLGTDLRKPRFVNWRRAERVGLTGEMLDLKRETLDHSLGPGSLLAISMVVLEEPPRICGRERISFRRTGSSFLAAAAAASIGRRFSIWPKTF